MDEAILQLVRALRAAGADEALVGRAFILLSEQSVGARAGRRVYIKFRQGSTHSSVSVPQFMLAQVAARLGGLGAARARVRALAAAAPPGVNRSRWVQQQLNALLPTEEKTPGT